MRMKNDSHIKGCMSIYSRVETEAQGNSEMAYWLERCTDISEVMVRICASLKFLGFLFALSCVFNCDDPLCIYFFFPQLNYMSHIFITYFSLLYFHRRATHLFPLLPY